MHADLPLFMRDAPHSGSPTSRDAAADIRKHLPRLESLVLVYVAGRLDGATTEEIEQALQLSGNTVRPRVVELRARRLIRDSGTTRLTRSGRKAIVYQLT